MKHGGGQAEVVELGVGSGEKLATLVEALPPGTAATAHLVDISAAALDATVDRLHGVPHLTLARYQATYEQGLHEIARAAPPAGPRLVLFLGSNIGNFATPGAVRLLGAIREAMRPGDVLLIGADLIKPPADLILAYDDPLGVTAAFNRNLLVRINRELGGNFDLARFSHRAVWNEPAGRVEMHLVSLAPQDVEIPAAEVHVHFERGDTIWTESSYKYSEDGIAGLGTRARFAPVHQWIDEQARFALTLFSAV